MIPTKSAAELKRQALQALARAGMADEPAAAKGKGRPRKPGIEFDEAGELPSGPMLYFREYQREVFRDKSTPVLILEWSRQIGKSHTLANWAVDRVLSQLSKPNVRSWLVVVISNSKANGAEFGVKVGEAAEVLRRAFDAVNKENGLTADEIKEFGLELDDCQYKLTLKMKVDGVEKMGRVLVLAASARTARGFSGDLILDEFAHHQEARALWAAAEPIISSNPDYLCRIASTHSTTGSLFYKWITMKSFPVVSVSRSEAWRVSRNDPVAPLKIISLKTGKEITPEEARDEADDQRNYDCNYENNPSTDSGALISLELISQATTRGRASGLVWNEDKDEWKQETLERLRRLDGPLYCGMDVGRVKDLSVVAVMLVTPDRRRLLVAMLTMKGKAIIPEQSDQLKRLLDAVPNIRRIMIDSTGEGIGLSQYMEAVRGQRVQGVDFRRYVRVPIGIGALGKPIEQSIPVTEQMGADILSVFRGGEIDLPEGHRELEKSLHLPERVVSTDGTRVMIAASRSKDEDGYTEHADRFWAVALCEHGIARAKCGAFTAEDVQNITAGRNLFTNPVISFPSPMGPEGGFLSFG